MGLTITKTQTEDSGPYTATAVNQAGEAASSAALNVTGDGKSSDEDSKKRKDLMKQGDSAGEQKDEEKPKSDSKPKSILKKKVVKAQDKKEPEKKEAKKEPKSP